METLSIDLKRNISLDLPPVDLIRLCLTSSELYENICNSDEFWRLKIEKDYPEVTKYFRKNNLILRKPKVTYIRVFSSISKVIEEESNDKQGLYDFLSHVYNDMRKNAPYSSYTEYNIDLNKKLEKYKHLYKYSNNDFLIKTRIWDVFVKSPLYKIYGSKPIISD